MRCTWGNSQDGSGFHLTKTIVSYFSWNLSFLSRINHRIISHWLVVITVKPHIVLVFLIFICGTYKSILSKWHFNMLINFTNSKNNILLTTTNCFQAFCFYSELTICERIISLPLKCFQPQTFAHLDSFKSNKHCKTKFQCHIQPLSVNLHLM